MTDQVQKVTADHLCRDAYLYVRQATSYQELPKKDSLQCQYALVQQVMALGWPSERVVVIDCDLGKSSARTHDRKGFQKLTTAVRGGRVGMVLALDVPRLSRNCRDWHHLLKACASNDTLVFVQDKVHDLARLDDRLLLGLERSMSETPVPRRCPPVAFAAAGSSSL